MKVIFFGSSKYVVPILEEVYKKHHQILLVVTTEVGNHEPVKFFCRAKQIKCITVRKVHELKTLYEIQSVKPDIGIVADFGIIIPENLIHVFRKGILNVHPSLLPKYRGAAPVQNAILNGDTKTGVSIILLDKLVDHGPVFAQKEETINPEDTAKTLYEKLFREGALLLGEVLQKYEHNNISPIPQNHDLATFTKMLTREDGFVDLDSLKIENWKLKIEPMVRAYYPWPGVWTLVSLNKNDEQKIVKLLPNQQIQVEGKNETVYKDFINGYPDANPKFLEFLRKAVSG